MSVEEIASRERDVLSAEIKSREEAECRELIIIGEEYIALRNTPGWKRLEKEVLDRTKSLSSRLLTDYDEKKIYRAQGELLGVQSILNIVETTIENMVEAKKQLEGEGNE